MMKRIAFIGLFAIVLVSFAYAIDCQFDGFRMMWTGATKIDGSKMLKEYRCLSGHRWWITSDQERQDRSRSNRIKPIEPIKPIQSSNRVTCPVDRLAMRWTGGTRTEQGKMFKIYRCLKGHETLVKF